MTKDETLRLALEALEVPWNSPYVDGCDLALGKKVKAITAIKAALEAKDEPVAWRDAAIRLGEELSSVGPDGYYEMNAWDWLDWALEQEPRGKNSLAQTEQEPVAWVCYGTPGKRDIDFEESDINALPIGTNLYTTPPQRTWVGLTDEDIENAYIRTEHFVDMAKVLDDILKEKNI